MRTSFQEDSRHTPFEGAFHYAVVRSPGRPTAQPEMANVYAAEGSQHARSGLFWPPSDRITLKGHPELDGAQDAYLAAYWLTLRTIS